MIYTENGRVKAEVRAGTGYTIYVSRGPEYTVQKLTSIEILSGKPKDLGTVTLKRVVNTSGYVSADFHIHSGRSLDASAPLYDRVRSFAGEGLEVMISTDHDVNTDYYPVIQKLKVAPFITSVVGTEVTTSVGTPPYFSNSWGHINAWPQIYNPDLRRSGSVEDENVSANVIYDRLRSSLDGDLQCEGGKLNGHGCATDSDCKGGGTCVDVGVPVVQLNHPLAGVSGVVSIGMFSNIGFDPSKAVTDCEKYPVICPTSKCFNGTNDGTNCTSSATCTGGGVCGCVSSSVPSMANGCNDILNDLNVVPQASLCTTTGCGSGFENPNGTRNIDFDQMEIDNGGSAGGFSTLKRVRRDWLSLLNQDVQVGAPDDRHPLWGTGVSDSHRIVTELPGYSRTYVGAGDLPAPPATLDVKAFNDEARAGNMMVSAGPFIRFSVDNGGTPAGLGQTLSATGSVNLNIHVEAPPWMPVDEVRIIKNGCVMACYNDTTSPAVNDPPGDPEDQTTSGVVRFDQTIPDTVSSDSYYIVEASPNMPSSGEPPVDPVVNAVAKGLFPFGFTNPIFVDPDGGGYTGIGAVEPTCGALPPSCSAGAAIASIPTDVMMAGNDSAKGLFTRMTDLISKPVLACGASSNAPTEKERLADHEKIIRKSSPEFFPMHLLTFPTPQPGANNPPAPTPGGK